LRVSMLFEQDLLPSIKQFVDNLRMVASRIGTKAPGQLLLPDIAEQRLIVMYCRWGWWRRASSQQERLLDAALPGSAAMEQHAIAIRTGSSPPSASAAAAAAQQQVASRSGSVVGSGSSPFAAAGVALGSGAPVRTITQESAGAAAAAGYVATPRASMERSKQSGVLRGSAGGKSSGKDGKDGGPGPGLGRSASIAAAGGGGGNVSDPLLQAGMLEKVNVLGKQVGWQQGQCCAAGCYG
jgi:hypothetical protein